jgi:hypothetical protein
MLNLDPLAALPAVATAKREYPLFRFVYLQDCVLITPCNFRAECLCALVTGDSDEPLTLTYEATAAFLGEISREEN